MSRLRIAGLLAGVASLLLSTAAFALPTLSPAGAVSFEGSTEKAATFATASRSISCSSWFIEASKNKIETGVEGPFHIMYSGCTETALKTTCTGLGELSGRILLLGTMHVVYDSLSPLGAAFLYSLNPNHLECGGLVVVLVVISGTLLCLIKPINEKRKEFSLKCEGENGTPKETRYWNDSGTEVATQLLSAVNGGAGEGTSLFSELTFTASHELDFVA